MSEQTRVLIVEDDPTMQSVLATHLAARGYDPIVAGDAWAAFEAMRHPPIHVVLLDITLPGSIDGIEACRRIRATSKVPIIIVSARQRPETKVQILDCGGDDYLVKPFDADELLARIRAVLRRSRQELPDLPVMDVDDLNVDFARRRVRHGNEQIHLTRTEFDLLAYLMHNPDRTLTYAQILESVWGRGYDDVRSVHAHISHLRRRISVSPEAAARLVAVPGVGYRFRMTN